MHRVIFSDLYFILKMILVVKINTIKFMKLWFSNLHKIISILTTQTEIISTTLLTYSICRYVVLIPLDILSPYQWNKARL